MIELKIKAQQTKRGLEVSMEREHAAMTNAEAALAKALVEELPKLVDELLKCMFGPVTQSFTRTGRVEEN